MRHMSCKPFASMRCPACRVIVSTNCKSAGEALREIDVKDVIKTDFVLVSGDVVSNMDLGAAMRTHRARRDKDKGAIMTMVRQPFCSWAHAQESLQARKPAPLLQNTCVHGFPRVTIAACGWHPQEDIPASIIRAAWTKQVWRRNGC